MNTSKYIVSGLWMSLCALVSCASGENLMYNQPSAESLPSAQQAAEMDERDAPEMRVVEREPPVDLEPAKAAAASALEQSVTHAADRVVGWWEPLPKQPDYRQLLDPDREFEQTISMGTVGDGKLINAAEVPLDSDYHSVIERHRDRDTQYGSPALIDVILHGAKAVGQAFPGSELRVGNMSYEHGGDIPWSRSHNSGRDADLAFFCKRKKDGEPVRAPGLLEFDANGQAIDRPDLVFDTARNWELVEALLTHDEVHIQWLFVSNPLKEMMLDHARAEGVSDEVLARAEKVLHQPTDALPHNDHFHLRITCPKRDRLEGCLDYGPRWEWVDWHYDELLSRTLAIAGALDEPDADTRARALDFLERIHSPYAPEIALDAALREEDDEVRRRALEVAKDIPNWSGAAVNAAIRFVERDEFSIEEKALAYNVLRRAVDNLAVEPLKRRVADPQLDEEERALAARSLVHFMEPELVPFLIDQLAQQPAPVAEQLAVVLRRVTNRSEDVDWADADDQTRQQTLANWQTWWEEHRDVDRDVWVEEGLAAHGFDSGEVFTTRAVGELISMLDGTPAHIAYNVNLTLKRVTDRWAPLEAWDNARLHRYWAKWWDQNRQRLLASN